MASLGTTKCSPATAEFVSFEVVTRLSQFPIELPFVHAKRVSKECLLALQEQELPAVCLKLAQHLLDFGNQLQVVKKLPTRANGRIVAVPLGWRVRLLRSLPHNIAREIAAKQRSSSDI